MSAVIEHIEPVHVPTREQVEALEAELKLMPQVDIKTEHYFSGGMYCRKFYGPKDMLVVGKTHRKNHFFICAKGEAITWSEKGMIHIREGDVICSKPNTKRVVLCLTDCILITCQKTRHTNLDKIEKEVMYPEENALYNSSNILKAKALEGK